MNVGAGEVTEPDDDIATKGTEVVVEVIDEVVVDVPADITFIKPETDTALTAVELPGPVVELSGASLITS